MRPSHKERSRFGRPAFTLVELIVVVTIIAILVSLSAAAVIRFITVQQVNNTQTTINKVYSRLINSYKAYRQRFQDEPIPQTVHDLILNNLTNPEDPNVEALIRVIYVKMRYKQTFPISFAEALNPGPLPPLPTYQAYLGKLGITWAMVSSPTYQQQSYKSTPLESSACLLMALTQGQSGGGVNAEDLAGGQSVVNFALVDQNQQPLGTTVPAFVDAWGNPLTFARWPTGCRLLINPSTTDGSWPGYKDPLDPEGFLSNNNPSPANQIRWLSTYGPVYSKLLHPLPQTGTYSYYLIPMIVSNGPDKKLGLDVTTPPTSTLTVLSHDADDNIYSTTTP